MNILITLCARGGSQGIPGKNIKILNGKPLIAYSIEHANEFSRIHNCDIALSTEDDKIKQIASQYGQHTSYTRPTHLATDTAGKIPAISSLLNFEEELRHKKYDYVLDLDVSAPMRTLGDLEKAFAILRKDSNALNIFSVGIAGKNPYFNLVEKSLDDGYYRVSKELPGGVKSRQEAPEVFAINGSLYFYTKAFFEQGFQGAITPKSLIFEMEHECFDLDLPEDFNYLEYLVCNNKLDYKI